MQWDFWPESSAHGVSPRLGGPHTYYLVGTPDGSILWMLTSCCALHAQPTEQPPHSSTLGNSAASNWPCWHDCTQGTINTGTRSDSVAYQEAEHQHVLRCPHEGDTEYGTSLPSILLTGAQGPHLYLITFAKLSVWNNFCPGSCSAFMYSFF